MYTYIYTYYIYIYIYMYTHRLLRIKINSNIQIPGTCGFATVDSEPKKPMSICFSRLIELSNLVPALMCVGMWKWVCGSVYVDHDVCGYVEHDSCVCDLTCSVPNEKFMTEYPYGFLVERVSRTWMRPNSNVYF